MNDTHLYNEARVYLKRKGMPDVVVEIAPEINHHQRRRYVMNYMRHSITRTTWAGYCLMKTATGYTMAMTSA
jgi:hypothetical protein